MPTFGTRLHPPVAGSTYGWVLSTTTAITASSSGRYCCERPIGTGAVSCPAKWLSRFELHAGYTNAGRWHFATDLPWFPYRMPNRFFVRPGDFQPGPMSSGGNHACI